MQEVNLSRLQHLIEEYTEEAGKMGNALEAAQLQYDFKVFAMSTDNDLAHFRKRLEQIKEELNARLQKISQTLDYVEYLRGCLGKANEECGVTQKLARINILNRKYMRFKNFVDRLDENHDRDLEPAQDVDFYKSAFTAEIKTYNLGVFVYGRKDYDELKSWLENISRERQGLNDQIAAINQKNIVQIKTFEEFCM